jgi:hypothetical protein
LKHESSNILKFIAVLAGKQADSASIKTEADAEESTNITRRDNKESTEKGDGIFIPSPLSIYLGKALFVGRFRTTSTPATTICGRTRRGLVAIALIVPAAALKGEPGLRNHLGYGTTTLSTLGERCIGKFLPSLKNQPAFFTLIFVHRHRKHLLLIKFVDNLMTLRADVNPPVNLQPDE